jgi:hypothetical protein
MIASSIPAGAQDVDREERARRLFAEANGLMDEGRFPDACDRLEQALELAPLPAVANNLAIARRATGDAVGAQAVLSELLAGSYGVLSDERRREVAALRREVAAEIATLRIRVTGAEQATVRFDGVEVGIVRRDVVRRVPANGGAHVVTATAEDGRRQERRLEVEPGETAEVALHFSSRHFSRRDGPSDLFAPAPEDSEGSGSALPWVLGVAGGLVAIGVAVVIVIVVAGGGSEHIDSPFPPVTTP